MSSPAAVPDLDARLRALDPERSFIVQAPAGSGKTELLIQRYLVLLARVEAPEEIAAITFTRKAAAEMRNRIIAALAAARAHDPSAAAAQPQRALTLQHARAALARDSERGWRLEEHATRLRIQTFDALCASLTRQMPILSALGAQPQVEEDARALYLEAARATLAMLEHGGHGAQALARLLAHLDGDFGRACDMIASMLAQRDHWLGQAVGGPDRAALEAALAAEVRSQAAKVRALLPEGAGVNLAGDAGAAQCRAFAGALLTREGAWRKRPPAPPALAASEALRRALARLLALPPETYSDAQWEALGAITAVLPLAAAQLRLVFAASGRADFAEIAQRALAALGTPEAPTDLLLALDYRIHHLLVDEFQDTSIPQLQLLERLTEGWQREGGRSLFLVGDPMQSIYRFRQAEVGVFLRTRREGLPAVRLEPLALSANFRSQAALVEWANRAFASVMPSEEDIGAGAVPHAHSDAARPATGEAVGVHAFFDGDRQGEARRVVELVRAALAEIPGGTIAILVRARGHLQAIVPALAAAGLRCRAIDIEPLGQRQCVQDLLALTNALSHPADRLAWLAVLRAPWCGLSLADLHALAGTDGPETPSPSLVTGQTDRSTQVPEPRGRESATIPERLQDESCLAKLSAEGRARALRTREVLERALAGRCRETLRERVEGAWLALGGPACLEDDTDLDDAEVFLDCLGKHERSGEIPERAAFEEAVNALHALPDVHAEPGDVQILTIHKAKGLEFDTVIVPGLGRAPVRNEPELFLWLDRPAEPGSLLMAPVKEAGGGKDPIYEYVAGLEREKGDHENGRLLYVAATRARRRLHLLGEVRLEDKDGRQTVKPPSKGSLLEKLWPAVAADFQAQAHRLQARPGPVEGEQRTLPDQDLRRLVAGWVAPPLASSVIWRAPREVAMAVEPVEFSWVGETARHVGSVVHRWLQRMAEDALEGWGRERIESLRPAFRNALACLGVADAEIVTAADRVTSALAGTLEDERGRWLLGPQAQARNEYRITSIVEGEVQRLVVDRSFVDAQGVRWIVDYKTSRHEGADPEGFLDRERERYRPQLERYAQAIPGAGRARLGLYFPLMSGWREWEAGG